MQKIKFRAWDKYGDSFYWSLGNEDNSFWGYVSEGILSDVEQFIGLCDKNDKEIYKGDIVKHRNGTQLVNWLNDCLAFDIHLSNYVTDQEDGICESEDIEVIGNIHQNSELLNG